MCTIGQQRKHYEPTMTIVFDVNNNNTNNNNVRNIFIQRFYIFSNGFSNLKPLLTFNSRKHYNDDHESHEITPWPIDFRYQHDDCKVDNHENNNINDNGNKIVKDYSESQ